MSSHLHSHLYKIPFAYISSVEIKEEKNIFKILDA